MSLTPYEKYESRKHLKSRVWYKSARWVHKAKAQLKKQPLCERCSKEGKIKLADVVNHITPHKENEELFWSSPVESSCKLHHDSSIKREENVGYSEDIDSETGLPTDPRHPFNKG